MIGRWSKPPVVEDEQPRGFDDYELRLGDVMRGERATLGKSLLDVQRELKIKATYIAAVENADPSVFETQGFIAGYVRSYARYLGMDPDLAFKRFCAESGFAVAHGMSPDASSASKAKAASQASKRKSDDPFANPNATFVPKAEGFLSRLEPSALGSTAVLIALMCAIGYGGWSVLQEIQKVQLAPVDQAPGVASATTVLPDGDRMMASLNENVSVQVPSAEALDRLYRPQALDTPVLVPRDGPIATLDPRAFGALAAESAEERLMAASVELAAAVMPVIEDETPVQVVGEDAPELALIAVRPSWVRVSGADGSVLFEKILDAGERYVLPATEEPPVLRTGNGGGIYFAVNGQAYGPAGAAGSVVKNIALSQLGISDAFASVDLASDTVVSKMFRVAQNAVSE